MKPVRVIIKEDLTADWHDLDRDCIPLDQQLDDHVNDIWQMMLRDHPELSTGTVTKEQKSVVVDAENSDWVQTFPTNDDEKKLHDELARKHGKHKNL